MPIIIPPPPIPWPGEPGSGATGGFVRHRDRMVQESVFEDLEDTLIAFRWMSGEMTRPPADPELAETTTEQVLKMVGGNPVQLISSFPEASGENGNGQVPKNTLALDDAQPGEPVPIELGSSLCEVPYRFNLAFWGASVGIAQALLNDLRDRYTGRQFRPDVIDLYDYNQGAVEPVAKMEVESFSYARDVEEVNTYELTLFFAQLVITDFVE